MSRPSIRLALVGYGAIARHHLAVFRHLGADIVASCNRSETGRALAVSEGGIPRAYADLAEMMDREHPDGVIVTASALALADVTTRLIPYGRPLLVEKPPGTSLAEVERLDGLARQHRCPVHVGLNRRFYGVYHQALAEMGGREAVTSVKVEWSEDPRKIREIGHPEALLPLLNFANSLHGIDLLGFFAGHSSGNCWGRSLGPGSSFRWQMGYAGLAAGGAHVQFDSTWDVPGRWRLVVDAQDVRLVSAPLESGVIFRRGQAPRELVPPLEDTQFKAGFHGQAAAYLRNLREGIFPDWPSCSLAEAIPAMRIASDLTRACAAPESDGSNSPAAS